MRTLRKLVTPKRTQGLLLRLRDELLWKLRDQGQNADPLLTELVFKINACLFETYLQRKVPQTLVTKAIQVYEGWSDRAAGVFIGLVIGFVLFVIAFIWWW